MTVGKIEQLTTAIGQIKNPGGGVRLASSGFTKRCRVCELHSHDKWHEVARGIINPIALLQLLDVLDDGGTGAIESVRAWVVLMGGIDVPAMRSALEAQQAEASNRAPR